MTSPSVTNLGTCWGTPNGQDLSTPSYMASGDLCVAEAILRRWSTTQGRLIDDPNYGYNLTDLISDDLTSADLRYAEQQASAQALLDERVRQCAVTLTLKVTGELDVVAFITTSANTSFRLVTNVPTTSLLLVSP
jgi:phage baseplate assembly protein W